jgi:hypothetical protein
MTPTARTLTYLRRAGYLAAVVEAWIPRIDRRRDLFGFADVLACHPRDGLFLLVQVTTGGHLAHRLKKAKRRPELALWLKAGGRVEVHGWIRRGGRWSVRRVEVCRQDLAGVVLSAPRPRRARRGERQRELFADRPAMALPPAEASDRRARRPKRQPARTDAADAG